MPKNDKIATPEQNRIPLAAISGSQRDLKKKRHSSPKKINRSAPLATLAENRNAIHAATAAIAIAPVSPRAPAQANPLQSGPKRIFRKL
jgi:hypothetical protein